jgi:hypothetical protein
VDVVIKVAAALREGHRQRGDRVSFTHIPVSIKPSRVLELLHRSSLADLLAAPGAPLTHPERPWYGPTLLVRAEDAALVAAGVTASVWDTPTWGFEAAEVVIWVTFANGTARAQQRLSLHSRESRTLTRVFYDEQRAETGYEGDDRVAVIPTEEQVADLLEIARSATTGE